MSSLKDLFYEMIYDDSTFYENDRKNLDNLYEIAILYLKDIFENTSHIFEDYNTISYYTNTRNIYITNILVDTAGIYKQTIRNYITKGVVYMSIFDGCYIKPPTLIIQHPIYLILKHGKEYYIIDKKFTCY